MADSGLNLHRVNWVEALPGLRMLSAARRAIAFAPLVLGLLCVTSLYVVGRTLDWIWVSSGSGAEVCVGGPVTSQVEAFAHLTGIEYEDWRAARRQEVTRGATTLPADWDAQTRRVAELVETRLAKALDAVHGDARMSEPEKSAARRRAMRLADVLRFQLAEQDPSSFSPAERLRPAADLWQMDTSLDTRTRVTELESAQHVLAAKQELVERKLRQPRGPFIALVRHAARSVGGAAQGLLRGRWFFGGGAYDDEPSLLGSIGSGLRGILWLLIERPWFALLYGAAHLVVVTFFGVAICRYAAIQAARDEDAPLGKLLSFACLRIGAVIGAPLMPLGIFLGAALLLWLISLLGAIPGVGGLIWLAMSLLYFLALLGGVVMVFAGTIAACASHLYAPTIAAEGSDAYDAVSRSAAYVLQRPWSAGLYGGILLGLGGVTFVLIRLIAMLILKFTHMASGAGLSAGGAVSSFRTDTVSRLDAIWRMPAWQDLPLLPSPSGPAFWGEFGAAPLSTTEWLSMGLIATWVFAVVALVAAFLVSFYFCGAMEAYFLLRRSIDAADFHELYYEDDYDPRDGPPEMGQPVGSPAHAAKKGTSLPVMQPPSPG